MTVKKGGLRYYVPDYDDKSIKNIEELTEILCHPISKKVDSHLHREDCHEDDIKLVESFC